MGRIGFWQLLLDDHVSWWEAQAINGAYDQAEVANNAAHANRYSIEVLERRLTTMSREVVMLRTALTVLVNTLRDTNVVDPSILDRRLEAAMEEAQPPEPRPNAANPQKPVVALPPVTCIRCRSTVPAASTNMTGDGPVCDRCPSA